MIKINWAITVVLMLSIAIYTINEVDYLTDGFAAHYICASIAMAIVTIGILHLIPDFGGARLIQAICQAVVIITGAFTAFGLLGVPLQWAGGYYGAIVQLAVLPLMVFLAILSGLASSVQVIRKFIKKKHSNVNE